MGLDMPPKARLARTDAYALKQRLRLILTSDNRTPASSDPPLKLTLLYQTPATDKWSGPKLREACTCDRDKTRLLLCLCRSSDGYKHAFQCPT